ncbi:MAG: type I DNA topoisomerase [Patescibacteria group bacterium]
MMATLDGSADTNVSSATIFPFFSQSMAKLLIVESPTKAKTITKFLGKEYKVISSFGHIRDLPKRTTGVDIHHGFKPTYEVPADKKDKVKALKDAAKGAEVYLATDEDREGEAIAWHIAEVLKLDPETAKRITFHEITKPAIQKALENTRHIDMKMVDAQQTRRILDRLVGYELSPLLWNKVQRGLSAGRVQSVAVRLVVERERERLAFIKEEYWSIEAMLSKSNTEFSTKLVAIGDRKIDKLDIKTQIEAEAVVSAVKDADFVVKSIEKKAATRKAPTPLTTSTLQQEAYNRLGMSAKQTMTLAQKLYETGRITYMRTDSMNLGDDFIEAIQHYAKKEWGNEYINGGVHYKTNKKGAQEAHEAIRPTNVAETPETLRAALDPGMWKLYDLIWRRTVASQLPSAKIERTAIDFLASNHTFRGNGSIVIFEGYMKVWRAAEDKVLPEMKEGDNVGKAISVIPEQHFTEPPARYSDASLIKIMEEYGIGRPSTYAPTLATIEARGYVLRDDNKKLYPSDIAFVVIDLLKEHFPQIVDYEFTATMEKKLDDIAEGDENWQLVLAGFYGPFHSTIVEKGTELSRESIMKVQEIGIDPATGKMIIARMGRFGPFVQLGEPEGEEKPRRASLEKTQTIDTLTIEQALRLLSLPRTLGKHTNGDEIIANVGRFGPYLKCGAINISLPPEHHPATITLEQAITLCTEGVAKKIKAMTPLAELGVEPETKANIVIKDGRYGPYVTDGKTNATIPKDIDPKAVTLGAAIELLVKKRASPKKAWKRKKNDDEE